MGVEVKYVIITDLTLRGKGVGNDPYRQITEIWDMDGNKIVEIDPYPWTKEETNGTN